MSDFAKRWQQEPKQGVGARLKDSIAPEGPLKDRLEQAIRQINIQVSKLDALSSRLKDRDQRLFETIVRYVQKHDTTHATVYANELAELRKMEKMIEQAKIAMEQIVLRLNTATTLGDVVVTLAPAMSVIKRVRAGLMGVMPEAEGEVSEINNLLSSILVDAGQMSGLSVNFETANEDAERILAEASAIAEQRMKEKLPELPTGYDTGLGVGLGQKS
ncbi:MAG: Snf7 family protein [Nitrososphaeria archaeon]|jgi:division protein CdvB (Snf7/Vps24/ESCRT-III family)